MASFFAPFAKFTVIHIYSFASFGRVVCWFGTAAQCVSRLVPDLVWGCRYYY